MLALVLALAAAAPPDPVCERLCLASVEAVGVGAEERMVLEASLVRAFDAPRCADPVTVDDACFGDDECVKKSASHGFVAVRAVRAGPELRLNWAASTPSAIRRGEHVEDAQTFYASGALDASIARGSCAAAAPLERTGPRATNAATPIARPDKAASTSTAAITLLAGGGALAVVSLGVFAVSAVALETASVDGKTKETAFVTGWIGVGTGLFAIAAAGVGGVLLYGDER